jgi:hypothetical protein
MKNVLNDNMVRKRGDERSISDHMIGKRGDENVLETTWLEVTERSFSNHKIIGQVMKIFC